MHVTITINSVVVQNATFDLCQLKTLPQIVKIRMLASGIPLGCPYTGNSMFCHTQKEIFKLDRFTQKTLSALMVSSPKSQVLMEIVHDSGTSCIQGETIIDNLT